MPIGPSGGFSTLVAVCEGTTVGDQIFGVVAVVFGLGVWSGIAWMVVGLERDTEERKALIATFGASALAGAAFMLSMQHLDLEDLILLSLGLAATIGVAGALLSRRVGLLPCIAAAIVGELALPVGVAAVLILYGFLGSGCLGDQLG
jgi:hypothetical protein